MIEFDLVDEALVLEPREIFDSCIIGVCEDTGKAIYSADKIIEALARDYMEIYQPENAEKLEIEITQPISEQEAYEMAQEWYGYNIESAYMGEMTPIYKWDNEEDS
jgi:hypothetical protein